MHQALSQKLPTEVKSIRSRKRQGTGHPERWVPKVPNDFSIRLQEKVRSGRVAVIEAGGFYEISNGNISQVPAGDGTYAGTVKDDWQPLVDWGYVTTPQGVSSGLELWRLS